MSDKTKPNYLTTILFPIFIFWFILSVETFAGSMGDDSLEIQLSDPDIINCEYKVIEAAYTPEIEKQFEIANAAWNSKDDIKAYRLLKPIAEQGHQVALTIVGTMHQLAEGGAELDAYKAREYYEKASCQGYAPALYHLGLIYYSGHGAIQHYGIAYNYFVKSAELGWAGAMHNAGAMALYGQGTDQDSKKAIYWFHKGATQESVHSMFNLGIGYFKGEGAPKDIWKSYMWFDLAEFLGDPKSSEWKKLLADEYLVSDEIKEIKAMAQECIANAYVNCGGRKI